MIDETGKWIVPGYVDTHVHLFDSGSLYTSPDDYDLTRLVPHQEERKRIQGKIESTLDRFLCSGVTTVASLGGARWELPLARKTEAPHLVPAGPFLANFLVGKVTLWTREDPVLVQIASPEAARAKVRELHRAGVGIIKVGYVGDRPAEFAPVVRALVDEAAKEGLRVAMHAEELAAAKMALESGVQVLAHTVSDRVVDDEFLSLAKSKGASSPSAGSRTSMRIARSWVCRATSSPSRCDAATERRSRPGRISVVFRRPRDLLSRPRFDGGAHRKADAYSSRTCGGCTRPEFRSP